MSYIEKLENQVEAQFLAEEIYYQQEKIKQGAGGKSIMNEETYSSYTVNNGASHKGACRKLYQMAEDLMRDPQKVKEFKKWQAERQKATMQEG